LVPLAGTNIILILWIKAVGRVARAKQGEIIAITLRKHVTRVSVLGAARVSP
jgi:hypothetical protein